MVYYYKYRTRGFVTVISYQSLYKRVLQVLTRRRQTDGFEPRTAQFLVDHLNQCAMICQQPRYRKPSCS